MTTEQRLEGCATGQGHPGLLATPGTGEGRKGSPEASRESPALRVPGFRTPSLQDRDRTFLVFSGFAFWQIVVFF